MRFPRLSKPGARRTVRTALVMAAGVLTAYPVLVTSLEGTPLAGKLGAVGVWVVAITRAWNGLEDRGVIPPTLRDDVPAPEVDQVTPEG